MMELKEMVEDFAERKLRTDEQDRVKTSLTITDKVTALLH